MNDFTLSIQIPPEGLAPGWHTLHAVGNDEDGVLIYIDGKPVAVTAFEEEPDA